MTQPETKTVLGRVFTWSNGCRSWQCETQRHLLISLFQPSEQLQLDHWSAELSNEEDDALLAGGQGPTAEDAILALQSTLRKMAELEVSGG